MSEIDSYVINFAFHEPRSIEPGACAKVQNRLTPLALQQLDKLVADLRSVPTQRNAKAQSRLLLVVRTKVVKYMIASTRGLILHTCTLTRESHAVPGVTLRHCLGGFALRRWLRAMLSLKVAVEVIAVEGIAVEVVGIHVVLSHQGFVLVVCE